MTLMSFSYFALNCFIMELILIEKIAEISVKKLVKQILSNLLITYYSTVNLKHQTLRIYAI